MDRRTFLRSVAGVAGAVVMAGAAATTAVEAAPIARADSLPDLPKAPASGGGHTPDGTEVEQAHYYYGHRRRYWRRRRRRVYYVRRRYW